MKSISHKQCVQKSLLFLSFVLGGACVFAKNQDFVFDWSGKVKEEMFYAKNSNLLNNANKMDKLWYAQHTFDVNFHTSQGMEKYGHDAIQVNINARNKARWANPLSVAKTTKSSVKIRDYVTPEHQHVIAKLIVWIREISLKFSINSLLDIKSDAKHFITLGAFPFQLGRGIALGDAFAVNPGILGFYSEDSVDQYAFGAQLSGDVVADKLGYDFYVGLLSNKAGSFRETSAKIRAQYLSQCDFLSGRIDPYRGPGEVNYVVAGRLLWKVFDTPLAGKLEIEPYAMYNHDPEQRVEVAADANSKLGTSGIAVEWSGGRFEGGFDTAFNFGRQQVVALDRNRVDLINDDESGVATFVYTHVLDNDPNGNKAKQTKKAKKEVNASSQNLFDNGQKISDDPLLYNAKDRFRDCYKNKYRGWMFVADASYWFVPGVLQGAVTAGVASGDENPNNEHIDGDYKGFIGLQEYYTGKRVRSAFILGGRSVPRPLSVPVLTNASDKFAKTISEFSNIIFSGFAFTWKPDTERQTKINPNVLWFWQESASRGFDNVTNMPSDCLARRFLGIEVNVFADTLLVDNLKGFLTASFFLPGTHYDDIKGKPLNAAQRAFLDRLDRTGFTRDPEPILGNDSAFTVNVGVEYKF